MKNNLKRIFSLSLAGAAFIFRPRLRNNCLVGLESRLPNLADDI